MVVLVRIHKQLKNPNFELNCLLALETKDTKKVIEQMHSCQKEGKEREIINDEDQINHERKKLEILKHDRQTKQILY